MELSAALVLADDRIIEVGGGENNVIHGFVGAQASLYSYEAAGRDLVITFSPSGTGVFGTVRIVNQFVGDQGIDALILNNGNGQVISLRDLVPEPSSVTLVMISVAAVCSGAGRSLRRR